MVQRQISRVLVCVALFGLPATAVWAADAAVDTAGGTDGTGGLDGTDGTDGGDGTDGLGGTDGTPLYDTGKEGLSAAEIANDKGGCSLVPAGAGFFIVPLAVGVARRRRQE